MMEIIILHFWQTKVNFTQMDDIRKSQEKLILTYFNGEIR